MVESKDKFDFKQGDKVFVTIKGFPAWLGVVEKLIENNNQTTYPCLYLTIQKIC